MGRVKTMTLRQLADEMQSWLKRSIDGQCYLPMDKTFRPNVAVLFLHEARVHKHPDLKWFRPSDSLINYLHDGDTAIVPATAIMFVISEINVLLAPYEEEAVDG